MQSVRAFLSTVRLTPAHAFLLGTGTMLLLPEKAFAWLSLNYHEIVFDNTYAIEVIPEAAETRAPEVPRQLPSQQAPK